MKTSFTTIILVDKPAIDVFNAVNNVSAWWQGEIEGTTNEVGDEFTYRMKNFHYSKHKVTELIPGKKVVWLVTDSNLTSFGDKTEWNGTKVIFDIDETNGQTQLRFTHEGLVPAFECYGSCSGAWGQLVQESLYSLIMTGKGKNVFG